MENIVTSKYPTPLTARGFEWMAHFGGDDTRGLYGFGATENEAINDLIETLKSETA